MLSAENADARPPLMLILGPAGAGKTEWALSRFLAAPARTLLIVSSAAQADTRAAQIAARSNRTSADVRPAIFTLRSFAVEITRAGTQDDGKAIGRAFQRLILTDVVRRTLRADDYFGGMRHAPGFVPALLERIREWKLACLAPDALEAAAEPVAEHLQDPTFARKVPELARLFRAYETFLTQNRLRDEEDYLRLAAERVRNATIPLPFNATQALVDGLYRFNRAQRSLLAAFASRGLDVGRPELELAVTLPYESDRPLLFAAPERTLRTLRAEFACRETTLPASAGNRPPALTTLGACLYGDKQGVGCRVSGVGKSLNASSVPSQSTGLKAEGSSHDLNSFSDPRPPSAANTRYPAFPTPDTRHPTPVLLFDAPNPYVEAEMVARAFRRLYDAGGYAWSDFTVILRTLGDYAPILAAVFERYGIPLGVDGPEKLAENPLIKTILHLLSVVRYDWQRDDVLAFLKSSYTAPDKLAADSLRKQARAAGVRAGREHWLALIEQHSQQSKIQNPKSKIDAPRPPTPDTLGQTLQELAQIDLDLHVPSIEPMQMADIIRSIVVTFGLEERIELGEPNRRERDRAALHAAQEVLYALAEMFALAAREPARGRAQPFSFETFYAELVAAWQSGSSIAAPDGDMVYVAEPYDTRDRSIKVAAVMGLTERVFPRRVTEDPFLRDEERAALCAIADIHLEAQRDRADDERFLFYLAVTAPSERLILSYPRASDESDTLPSFYLDEVKAALLGTEGEKGRRGGKTVVSGQWSVVRERRREDSRAIQNPKSKIQNRLHPTPNPLSPAFNGFTHAGGCGAAC